MRPTTSSGSPITLSLVSNKSMFITSKAELRSMLAINTWSPSSRDLAMSDCNWSPSVVVLLFFKAMLIFASNIHKI